jgi:hypothetical protein
VRIRFVIEGDRIQLGSLAPAAAVWELGVGYFVSRTIYAGIELGVMDALAVGPRSASEVAAEQQLDAPSLFRLMRALAASGILAQLDDGRFQLAAMGEVLVSGHPSGIREGLLMFHQPMFWKSWEGLADAVRKGGPAFDQVFGQPVFDWLTDQPEASRHYNTGMTGRSAGFIPAIVGSYDFAPYASIVDVGGGHGSFLAAILAATPGSQGTLFDLPHVASGAQPSFDRAGVADRTTIATGNVFESVPAGADLYTMKWILHDWDDAACLRILANLRQAMSPGSKLLVVERVMPERAEASLPQRGSAMTDLVMMVHLIGKERTEREFADLFGQAGFKLELVVTTGCPLSIVEAAPA